MQADLSLRGAHMSENTFSYVVAHIHIVYAKTVEALTDSGVLRRLTNVKFRMCDTIHFPRYGSPTSVWYGGGKGLMYLQKLGERGMLIFFFFCTALCFSSRLILLFSFLLSLVPFWGGGGGGGGGGNDTERRPTGV